MKPRLDSREFTEEDVDAICHLCRRWMLGHGEGSATRWLLITRSADFRDADLMYRAQRAYASRGWVPLALRVTDCDSEPIAYIEVSGRRQR